MMRSLVVLLPALFAAQSKRDVDTALLEKARALAPQNDPDFEARQAERLAIAEARDRIPFVAMRPSGLYNFWQDADHVRGIVRRDGTIDNVEVIKDLPYGLGEEARRAVSQWRFRPATYRGEAIDVYYTVTVNFRLQ